MSKISVSILLEELQHTSMMHTNFLLHWLMRDEELEFLHQGPRTPSMYESTLILLLLWFCSSTRMQAAFTAAMTQLEQLAQDWKCADFSFGQLPFFKSNHWITFSNRSRNPCDWAVFRRTCYSNCCWHSLPFHRGGLWWLDGGGNENFTNVDINEKKKSWYILKLNNNEKRIFDISKYKVKKFPKYWIYYNRRQNIPKIKFVCE